MLNSTLPPFKSSMTDLSELAVLEYSQLLELIPAAAIVYLRDKDCFRLANQKFLTLSDFTPVDIETMQLSGLMPYETDTNVTGQQSRPTRIRRADGDIINTDMWVYPLNLSNSIVVLTFYPPSTERTVTDNFVFNATMYDEFSSLSQLSSQSSTKTLIHEAALIIKRVLNAPFLAFYQVHSGANNGLNQYPLDPVFNSDQLPKSIPASTASIPSFNNLWHIDLPPNHRLHEYAIQKDFRYLVTLPIVEEKKCHGVFLSAGLTPIPKVETMRFLSLLANHTATSFGKLNALENATKRLQTMRHIVQIERDITENMSEGLIILTPDLKIAEMNASAENMLRYASKEVFLQDIQMVLIANENLSSLYKSAQEGISTISGTNLMLNDRHGNAFQAQITCIPVELDGKVKSIIILLRDLSQTEQLLQHSKQLEQRAFLGEVSAIFAHEVKNPIHSLGMGLELMTMRMNSDDPNYDLVLRLQQVCQRLNHLTKSTLTFAKPVVYQPTAMNLTELISNILERWVPRMTRLNIEYRLESEPEQAIIDADARAIEQVFVNLISNGIQAMDQNGGTLLVKIAPAEDSQPAQYEIIVADSGPGIPDDMINHIFEPFLTTKTSGTGLGLAITKRIINAHKGNIFVESYPGGTMFHVQLPKANLKEKNDN